MVSVVHAAVLLAVTASAGSISIQTTTRVEVADSVLRATVALRNGGDEAAHNVQIRVQGEGFTLDSSVFPELGVGKAIDVPFRQTLPSTQPPGRYPLFVQVQYTDANRYPFSAVAADRFASRVDAAPGILAILDSIETSRQGTLTLSLKNIEQTGKTVSIGLFHANELSSPAGKVQRELGPNQELQVRLPIRNFSALPGSSYPVIAILEYSYGGLHHTATAHGTVGIVAERSILSFPLVLGAVTLAFLVASVLLNVRAAHARK